MSLQAAPALELASEEQGLAELNAVTGDRVMAESNAADLDSAQFPLPSGPDSTAGETLLPLLPLADALVTQINGCMMSWLSGQDCVVSERPWTPHCCADAKQSARW